MKSWGCCLREPVPYETRERWSFSPPCWGLNERLPSANQGESLPGNYPASTWTLDFPAPRSLRNQFPLFKPPSLWHLLQQPILTRQQVYLICDNSSHSVPMTCALHHMCATFQNTRKGKAVTAETASPRTLFHSSSFPAAAASPTQLLLVAQQFSGPHHLNRCHCCLRHRFWICE